MASNVSFNESPVEDKINSGLSNFQVQYGSSSLPQKFYTGEIDAFWRNETSFEESRRYYLEERDKLRLRQAQAET